MTALTYRLRLLEPVLISQIAGGEENSAIGLYFVPGSAVRGVLADRYLQRHPTADPGSDPTFRQLFLDGSVCFLNAYPWREETRTLPTPLSWMAEKEWAERDAATVYDWARYPDQRLEHPKAPAGTFCSVTENEAALCSPTRHINVHITLNNVNERTDANQVYRYEALAADEVLGGAIIVDDPALARLLAELLTVGDLSLGGAHLAGYGRAQVLDSAEDAHWKEYAAEETPSDQELVVTLLSDAVVRGPSGQYDGDVNAALAALLGNTSLRPLRVFERIHQVGGYNRKWSLPLPQAWAAQMGSVYVYPAGTFDPAQSATVVSNGIGERRAEGFGRVAINWQARKELHTRKAQAERLSPAAALTASSRTIAQDMADRRLRLLLERTLVEAVSNTSIRLPRPQNAQLARLRSAVQQALVAGDIRPVTAHLEQLKGARDQFERARVGEAALLHWITERANKLDIEIQLLRSQNPPEVAGQRGIVTQALKVEYTARLLDGVLKKAARANQQERGAQ